MEIDLAPFLAILIKAAEGEIRIPYELYLEIQREGKAVTIDWDEASESFVLGLVNVEDIPEDDE